MTSQKIGPQKVENGQPNFFECWNFLGHFFWVIFVVGTMHSLSLLIFLSIIWDRKKDPAMWTPNYGQPPLGMTPLMHFKDRERC